MDPKAYLISQGWREGEPLQRGGLKKPLLVKHRKDFKGLGFNPLASEGWWERVFDGHLKSLDATTKSGSVQFSQDQEKLRKATSELYARFLPGGVLDGTIELENKEKKDSSSSKSSKTSKKSKKKESKKKSKKDPEHESSHKKRKRSKESMSTKEHKKKKSS